MNFRSREAARIYKLRTALFSAPACESLVRDRQHFDAGFEQENIYSGFRQDALEFFKARKIKWHGGGSCDTSIVSSQVACVNCFFPFTSHPSALKRWLSNLYPDLADVLPIVLPITGKSEPPLANGDQPFLTFEWIGQRNYLGEPRWGSRGQNCTSVDVMFRFRTIEKRIHVVLAEWKYCENDERAKYQHISSSGTDRVTIYRSHLDVSCCQISLGNVGFEDLFFNPLYQFMRQQLLASAMEREREMDADIVSVLHIAPRANDGLLNLALSEKVVPGASSVADVWKSIAKPGRFKSVVTEDLVPLLVQSGADQTWCEYIDKRYGAIV